MLFAVSLYLLLRPQAHNSCVIFRLLSFLKREWEVAFEIAPLQAVNTKIAGNMILVTKHAFARGDIRNEEKYINPVPDKAEVEDRSNF